MKGFFQHYNLRGAMWNVGIPCAATVSAVNDRVRAFTTALLRALGWWGPSCVEWCYDERTQTPKRMEPNARIGATVWAPVAAGVNTPLLAARILKIDYKTIHYKAKAYGLSARDPRREPITVFTTPLSAPAPQHVGGLG